MQRTLLLGIAIALALTIAGYLYFTPSAAAPDGPRPDDAASTMQPAPDSATGDAELSATVSSADTPQRTLVTERPERAEYPIAGTNVLRVILEGISEESAAKATITVATYDQGKQRTARITQSWPSQGSTSAFALDPYLALVAEQLPDQSFDELKVAVEHPRYLREIVRVPATAGVDSDHGQIVYEVRVQFAEVVFWPELELSVRDATTKQHLEDIELRCVPTAFMGLRQQPGTEDPFTMLASDLRSPITLLGGRKTNAPKDHVAGIALRPPAGTPPLPVDLSQPEETERGVMVYARAPGYAWGRIVLDVSKGSERELLLGPATTLDVRFTNVQLDKYAMLEKPATLCIGAVRSDGEVSGVFFRQLDETLATEGVRVDGLEPGKHRISVELGPAFSWRKRHVLARETRELLAGKQTQVLLALTNAPAPPEPATLGGTLSFPAFDGEKDVRLWLYKSDYLYGEPDFEFTLADMTPTAGTLPTWAFRLEGLPTGRYQARLMPFETNWIVDLPAGGRDDVRLVVPELAEVFVETIDAQNGELVPLEVIRFFTLEELPDRIHHEHSSRRSTTRFADHPGRFRFWTVPGPAFIRTHGIPDELNLAHRQQDVVLVPGRQHIRFELAPGYTIKFEFRDKGTALPHDDGIHSGLPQTIRAIGHDGRVGYLTYWMLQADKPGLYEISFEGIGQDRFRPIAPRRIEVREGQITEVIVDLERK